MKASNKYDKLSTINKGKKEITKKMIDVYTFLQSTSTISPILGTSTNW